MNTKINTRDELPALFVEMGYQKGVEVGVRRGDYSQHITSTWKGILYLVDAWKYLDTYRWGPFG